VAFETGILISVDSTQAKAGAQQVNQALGSIGATAETTTKRTDAAMSTLQARVRATGATISAMRGTVQQLSFQFNDIVTQLAAGTNAFTVFAQQGGQIAQIFGPLAGIIGVAAVGLIGLGRAYGATTEATEKAITAEEAYQEAIKKTAEVIQTAQEKARALADQRIKEAADATDLALRKKQEELKKIENRLQQNQSQGAFFGGVVTSNADRGDEDRIARLRREITELTQARAELTAGSKEDYAKLAADLDPVIEATSKYTQALVKVTEARLAERITQEEASKQFDRIDGAYRDELAALDPLRKTQEDYNKALVAQVQAQMDAEQSINDQIEGIRREAAELGKTAKDKEISVELRKAEAAAIKGQIDLTPELIEQIKKEAGARHDLKNALTVERRARIDADHAAAEAQAAMINDPTMRRQAEVAADRQRKIMELTAEYGTVAEGTGKKLLEMWDAATASREQARFWNDIRRQAQDISRDISDFLVDGFVNAEKGGKSAFHNLWEGALAGAKRFAARLAATILEQKIILPIAMQFVGAAPGLFGIASAAGGAAGGNGGGLFGGGGLGGLSNLLPNPLSVFQGGGATMTGYGGGLFTIGGNPLAQVGYGLSGLFGGASAASFGALAPITGIGAIGPGGLLAGGGATSLAAGSGALSRSAGPSFFQKSSGASRRSARTPTPT
jgi:hypothetical protein